MRLLITQMNLVPKEFDLQTRPLPDKKDPSKMVDIPYGFSMDLELTVQSDGDCNKYFTKKGVPKVNKIMDHIFRGKIIIKGIK